MIVEAHPFSQNSATQFTYQARPEWLILQQKFSTGITLPELRSIAFLLQQTLKLKKIPRDNKRSFEGLVSWFIREWKVIFPALDYIQLFDENLNEISFKKEQSIASPI